MLVDGAQKRSGTQSSRSASTPPACPDDNDILSYLEGDLDATRGSEVERHVDECANCRRVLAELGRGLVQSYRNNVAVTEATVLTTAGGRGRSAGAGRGLGAKNHSSVALSTIIVFCGRDRWPLCESQCVVSPRA